MKRFHYPAIVFRQQKLSPIQVAFVAHSGDILKWSGVPRKSDELLTGYQRFRNDDRIDREIVPFFQDPTNCSPTAAIVALRSESGVGRCIIDKTIPPTGQPIPTTITIEVNDKLLESDSIFDAALEYIDERLGSESASEDQGEESEDDTDAEDDSDTDEPLHLGSVTLARMRSLLADPKNRKNEDFRRAIADYVKPAFLIDGQHRISAAAKFGRKGLPFIVCGLYDASWQEQVFHFTVVNLKPKSIPPALITSIAGLSLTRHEQEGLADRLQQAGIRMQEVNTMSLVAYDDRSPFCDMVDMAVSKKETSGDKLGYGVMKRIAMVWHRAKRTSLTNIAQQATGVKAPRSARMQWREQNLWFDFFSAFWSQVRASVPQQLWAKSPDNRLLIGAHLWALQESLLAFADGQVAEYWTVPSGVQDVEGRISYLQDRLAGVTRTCLAYFPTKLWTVEWKPSQDTNAGRDELFQLFNKFIGEGKTSGKWKKWEDDPWFKRGRTGRRTKMAKET